MSQENKTDWLERIGVIASILGSVVAVTVGIYAIRISGYVLEKEKRPWLGVVKVKTVPSPERKLLFIKPVIENAGQVPAIATLNNTLLVSGKQAPKAPSASRAALWPGQSTHTSLKVGPEDYEEVLLGRKSLQILVQINYSDDPDEPEKYYTAVELNYQLDRTPTSLADITPVLLKHAWRFGDKVEFR